MSGIITIPFGLLAGGLTAGMPLSLIILTIPIIIVAALIILGLWLAPKGMIKGFQILVKA